MVMVAGGAEINKIMSTWMEQMETVEMEEWQKPKMTTMKKKEQPLQKQRKNVHIIF